MNATLQRVRDAAAPYGLNLVAAIRVDAYDGKVACGLRAREVMPHANSIVAIANGGGDLWRALKQHSKQNPGWWNREHPLDDFTHSIIETEIAPAARASGSRCRVIYPFMGSGPTLNFIELGKAAGLAGPSVLGVVVNPVFGPWIAFRAAILTEELIDSPGNALGFDPCPSCTARTCISACPAQAVAFPNGWDIPRCLVHRVESEPDCAPRCHARVGCILGPEHRYPDDELAYHQMRALRAMRPYYEKNLRHQGTQTINRKGTKTQS
ncbi:MAG TPA: hypothetical protein VIX12_06345 [Candidatus Binataceae bacterium]